MLNKLIIGSIILFSIALISLFLVLSRNNDNKTETVNNNPNTIDESDRVPSDDQIVESQQVDVQEQTQSYSDPKGFTYEYPKTWTYIPNREGIGLLPIEICNISCNIEILTIGSRVTNENNMDPKELTVIQFGTDYAQSNYTNINGSQAFYAVYERDAFRDITYTIVSDGVFIQTKFREELIQGINTEKFYSEAENIVKSIKF